MKDFDLLNKATFKLFNLLTSGSSRFQFFSSNGKMQSLRNEAIASRGNTEHDKNIQQKIKAMHTSAILLFMLYVIHTSGFLLLVYFCFN